MIRVIQPHDTPKSLPTILCKWLDLPERGYIIVCRYGCHAWNYDTFHNAISQVPNIEQECQADDFFHPL